MTTNNEEKEILQKLVGLIYDLQDYFGFNLEKDRYFGKESCSCLEDYEEEDMDRFYKDYPYCKIIPYRIMLEIQRFYNDAELSAGWCGVYSPQLLITCLEKEKKIIGERESYEDSDIHKAFVKIMEECIPQNTDFIKYNNFTNEKNGNGVDVLGKVEIDGSMHGYIDREMLKDILLSQGKKSFGEDINFDIDEFVDNVIKEYWKDKNNDKK
nr:MAG TPA: hypothetical protein [Caudoviricetes sp.]